MKSVVLSFTYLIDARDVEVAVTMAKENFRAELLSKGIKADQHSVNQLLKRNERVAVYSVKN